MFTRTRLVGMAIALLVALVCTSGVAYAADPNYDDPSVVKGVIGKLEAVDDPRQAFSQLPPAAQQAVVDFLTVASVETVETIEMRAAPSRAARDGAQAQAASGPSCGCATQTVEAVLKNHLGLRLFTYQSETSWCWDGTQITDDPFFNPSGYVHMILWEFVGHQRTNESGGQGQWLHKDFAQGHFRLCAGSDLGCVLNYYPVIRKQQDGNGGRSSTSTTG